MKTVCMPDQQIQLHDAGYFEAGGGSEVQPLRMSGVWRALETMPLLLQPQAADPPTRAERPRASAGGRSSSFNAAPPRPPATGANCAGVSVTAGAPQLASSPSGRRSFLGDAFRGSDAGTPSGTIAQAPTATAGAGTGVSGDGAADLMREIVAVASMDDVHLCRLMHAKEHGAPAPFVRLSRLFTLGISKVLCNITLNLHIRSDCI